MARITIQQISKSKFKNKRCEYDGKKFASIKECKRYMILKDDLRAGKITRLSLQVDFKIIISNLHVCTYRADFTYHDRNGNFVVEDTKGKITDVYRIKRNLMLSVFGIKILET